MLATQKSLGFGNVKSNIKITTKAPFPNRDNTFGNFPSLAIAFDDFSCQSHFIY